MAGETEPGTKYCSNCKRDIAAVNFVMHEVHCHKNIVLCDVCGEPVARSELDSHHQEEHKPVPCELCQREIERNKLDEHKKDTCPKRPVICPYCELDLVFDQLEAHTDYCGTRTEPCLKCSQYVMHKDLARHEQSNCSYPQPKPAPRPSVHVPQDAGNYDYPRGFGRSDRNQYSSQVTSDNDVTGPRPRINHRTSLNKHTNRVKNTNVARGRANAKRKPASERKSILNFHITDTDYLPNAHPSSYTDHTLAMQLAAGLDLEGSDHDLHLDDLSDSFLAQRMAEQSLDGGNSSSASSGGIGQQNRVRNEPISERNDTVMLPCEHCGENFPLTVLLPHQNSCTHDGSASSGPLSTDSSLNNHRPDESPGIHRGQLEVIDNLSQRPGSPRFAGGGLAEGSEILFPCEFCEDTFPHDLLLQHQSVCEKNPYQTPRTMTPKVPNQPPGPTVRANVQPKTTNRLTTQHRYTPSESNPLRQKKVPNTSITPGERKSATSTRTNRVLDDFRSNPSYSPINLNRDPTVGRQAPTGYQNSRRGGLHSQTLSPSNEGYTPSFSGNWARGSNNTRNNGSTQSRSKPRLVPRSTFDTSDIGASGTSLRTTQTNSYHGNSNRGRKVKRPQNDV